MAKSLKIRKTVIKSRAEAQAKIVERIIIKGKKIKEPSAKRKEAELFQLYLTQRQSMKKAHALNRWQKFVNLQTQIEAI